MVSREQYEALLARFLLPCGHVQTDDPIRNYDNLEGRFLFAMMLNSYMQEHVLAMRVLHSVLRDARIRIKVGKRGDEMYLVKAYIELAKLNWQLYQNFHVAEDFFRNSLDMIDQFDDLQELTGRIFYERTLILLELGQHEIAMNIAHELQKSFEKYSEASCKTKKMFYVHMAIAAIAYHGWIYDVAVDHLWNAFQYIEESNQTLVDFIHQQYRQRHDDCERAYFLMQEHLEIYL
jgi:hypothetical protein